MSQKCSVSRPDEPTAPTGPDAGDGIATAGRIAPDGGRRIGFGRRDVLAMGIIGLAALGLRLGFAEEYVGHPIGRIPWVDEGAYWQRAQAIRDGAWLPDRPYYQDPLYPYLLAVVMRCVGAGVNHLRLASACLGALTPIAIFVAGRVAFGRMAGAVAGGLLAAYGPLIFADGSLEKEGPAALGAAIAMGLTAWAARRAPGPRIGRWPALLAGLAWGVVGLLRANALVVGPLGAAWWWRRGRPQGRPADPAGALAFSLGFLLAMAPPTWVNRAVDPSPEWIATTWQAGANFYIGNGPEATGTYAAPPFVTPNPANEADDFAAEARRRAGRDLSCGEISRFWFREGLRRWRDAPGASARLLAKKFGWLLHDSEIPDNQDADFVRAVAAPRIGWVPLGFGGLLALAAVGAVAPGRQPFRGFVVLSTCAGLGSTALFFVVGRYRLPWAPGLALLGGLAVSEAARAIAEGRIRPFARRAILAGLPALVLAFRPITDPAPDRWAHSQVALALAYLNEWNLESAIDAWDDARALGRDAAGQVEALLSQGPVRDRMAAMVGARLAPDWPGPVPAWRRARWLRQAAAGREESRGLLDTLIRSDPADPVARRESGAWWLGEAGDPGARARAAAELALAATEPSAAILRSLLERDPTPLAGLSLPAGHPMAPRLRLARAILADRAGTPRPTPDRVGSDARADDPALAPARGRRPRTDRPDPRHLTPAHTNHKVTHRIHENFRRRPGSRG